VPTRSTIAAICSVESSSALTAIARPPAASISAAASAARAALPDPGR
jgi:hypothetical protein